MSATNLLEDSIVNLRNQIEQQQQLAADARTRAETRMQEIKASGTDPLADKTAFEEIQGIYREADTASEEASDLQRRLDAAYQMAGRQNGGGDVHRASAPAAVGSLADRFLASNVYQELRASGVLETGSPIGAGRPVEVATRDEAMAFLAATATIGALVPEDQRLNQLVSIPVRRIRVFDLITMGTTDSDLVEYVEETVRTDAAAETPFGTAAGEATYTYVRRDTPVKRIPAFVPATKGNLADAGQARTLLEGRLMNSVERRFEGQIVSGDGTGDNLTGILNTSGLGAVARDTAGGEKRLEAIHRGMTAVRISLEDEPTAVGIHPTTYEQTVFEKDTTGNYLLAPDVSGAAAKTIWGLPAIISTVFPAGTAVVGNWREAIAWVRSGVAVSASDSHSDFFTRGMVALLAEMRAAFRLINARAFAGVTSL